MGCTRRLETDGGSGRALLVADPNGGGGRTMRGRGGGACHDSEAEASGSSNSGGKAGVSARHCRWWSLGRISLPSYSGGEGLNCFQLDVFSVRI